MELAHVVPTGCSPATPGSPPPVASRRRWSHGDRQGPRPRHAHARHLLHCRRALLLPHLGQDGQGRGLLCRRTAIPPSPGAKRWQSAAMCPKTAHLCATPRCPRTGAPRYGAARYAPPARKRSGGSPPEPPADARHAVPPCARVAPRAVEVGTCWAARLPALRGSPAGRRDSGGTAAGARGMALPWLPNERVHQAARADHASQELLRMAKHLAHARTAVAAVARAEETSRHARKRTSLSSTLRRPGGTRVSPDRPPAALAAALHILPSPAPAAPEHGGAPAALWWPGAQAAAPESGAPARAPGHRQATRSSTAASVEAGCSAQ